MVTVGDAVRNVVADELGASVRTVHTGRFVLYELAHASFIRKRESF